jgi:hypothetical protein
MTGDEMTTTTSSPVAARYRIRGWDRTRKETVDHEFEGLLLVDASTRAPDHVPEAHDPGKFATQFTRCSACRWTELRVYRVTDAEPTWVLESIGRSVVPGERDRPWFRVITDAREVVASQVQRDRHSGELRVPAFARRALDDAPPTTTSSPSPSTRTSCRTTSGFTSLEMLR